MDIISIISSYSTALINWFYNWIRGDSTPANSSSASQKETSESSSKDDIPVSNPPQTLLPGVQEGSSPVQTTINTHPVHYHHSHILTQFNSFSDRDETAEVDKINIIVKCAGNKKEVDIFPLESISVLLKEACDWAGKNPKKMTLVYDGNILDVNKTVSQYGLRGGTTVNLIHA